MYQWDMDHITIYRRFSGDRRAGGFTLAEAMMAVVVLAIAAAGVLLPFTTGATVRSEGAHRTLGAKLGSGLMEKVLCTEADQIVTAWDGYSEGEGEVTDSGGAAITDRAYGRFSRDVSCEEQYVGQQIEGSWQSFVLVTVRVLYAGNEVAVIRRLVSK